MTDDYEKGYDDGVIAGGAAIPELLEDIDELAQKIIQLEDRIAELEAINFALSEDSALVANENAELRAALAPDDVLAEHKIEQFAQRVDEHVVGKHGDLADLQYPYLLPSLDDIVRLPTRRKGRL